MMLLRSPPSLFAAALLFLMLATIRTVGQDSAAGYRVDELKQKLAAEKSRQQAIEKQVQEERASLDRMRVAIEELRAHYRTVKEMRADNLAVAVLDREASEAFSRTVFQLKRTKAAIGTGNLTDVSAALKKTQNQIADLQVTVRNKSSEERQILESAGDEELSVVRARALTVMEEMKTDLRSQIKAVAREEKMKVENVAVLMDRVQSIDEGMREMERAGSSGRVGKVLAAISLDPEQMQLLDRQLGLNGKRGREMVQTVAGREVAQVKQSALSLMKIIKGDLKEKIRANTSGERMEVGRLTRLQAKLKRMDEGIAQVERAGTSDKVGGLLATIQLDLKSIGSLRARRVPGRITAENAAEEKEGTQPELETAVEGIMMKMPPSADQPPFSVYRYISPSLQLRHDDARNMLRAGILAAVCLVLSLCGTLAAQLCGRRNHS